MTAAPNPWPAFSVCGIELEYMIVDTQTLSVRPIADELLQHAAGSQVAEFERGHLGWSNELALHLIEIKNIQPDACLDTLLAGFQAEIACIDEHLAALGARLMPTSMHPWMNPRKETRIWPHQNAELYSRFNRIFNCRQHGWANLQSMQVNLPFADDSEFSRLHAAVRILMPLLPALAASSPVADGCSKSMLDFRMESYRHHLMCIPSLIGEVIPDTVCSREEYESSVLAPMYRDIAPLDPEKTLQYEWLNARGAIPRFDRNALEIRVIDLQECPQADLAIAALTMAVVRALYQNRWSSLQTQQAISTDALVNILLACIRDADRAMIDDPQFLSLFGFSKDNCEAGELWQYLFAQCAQDPQFSPASRQIIATILQHGTLARRILAALGEGFDQTRLEAVYRQLCDCLAQGRLFLPGHE